MELHRVTPNAFDKSFVSLSRTSYDFRCSADAAIVQFHRFGEGTHRASDFEVMADWEDVEFLIDRFCGAGNPKAIALRNAMKLAAAAEELGWQPPAPQSN
jgi:hypothetical protein